MSTYMQQVIERAQAHIDRASAVVSESNLRQRFHLMGPCGWINDPNGLIFFRGQYHAFYQFNPYDGFWGTMHWGHAVSDDLLHWDHLPIALAPSEPYDDYPKGGCFSGSAIEKDGKLLLFYTGSAYHGHGVVQTQNVAISDDGVHFRKYEGNPVIEAPEGVDGDCFRDPKVWEHDGGYYMVVGARFHGRGAALLFRSPDALAWEYVGVLHASRGEWGHMWECPDFFPLGDRWVLTCSPMGAGDHTAVYWTGDFDYDTGRFVPTVSQDMDRGFDFYASQSLLDARGRRIAIGWANEWEWMPWFKDWGPTYRHGWCGSFNIPRQLTMMPDGTVAFEPIDELRVLRRDAAEQRGVLLFDGEAEPLRLGDGVHFDMHMELNLKASDADSVVLTVRASETRKTTVTLDLSRGLFLVDRGQSDGWSEGCTSEPVALSGREMIDIRVVSDTSSLEVFLDGGRSVHSLNVFPDEACVDASIEAFGGTAVLGRLCTYGLEM